MSTRGHYKYGSKKETNKKCQNQSEGQERKHENLYLLGVPKGKKEESREAIFEKLMTKNFSDLIKDMSLHIEKAQ